MPDFLTVNVDRAKRLTTPILSLDSRTIRPSLQSLITDQLQVTHVPLVRGAVLLPKLPPPLLNRSNYVRVLLRVGQVPAPVLRKGFRVASTDRRLLERDTPIVRAKLLHEGPLLRRQSTGLVRRNTGRDPRFDNRGATTG